MAVMKQLRACNGGALALLIALCVVARAHASIEEQLIAIDAPELKDTTTAASDTKPGRRILAACADTVYWCASWKKSGYCAPQYIYNFKSVKDVVCAKTCNGAPCQSGSGCVAVTGYTVKANTDHKGDNIREAKSVADAARSCSSTPACAGFTGKGWLKTKVTPTQVKTGSCLYIKNGGSGSGDGGNGGSGNVTNAGCADSAATLAEHNTLRALHSSPALQWSASLAHDALAWARNLTSQGCSLKHGGYGNAGQNLFAMSGLADMNCVRATDAWYSEISNYNFTNTPWTSNQANFGKVGHFTQLVWKSTTQLGCGAAKGPNNCYVVACHYLPAGNYIYDSTFLSNVLPKKA